jgi:hypothetical protein
MFIVTTTGEASQRGDPRAAKSKIKYYPNLRLNLLVPHTGVRRDRVSADYYTLRSLRQSSRSANLGGFKSA